MDDGDTALEAMRAERPDMVLMDVRMPRMNGIEAVRAIRGEAALKDVKVIAVTASVFPEFREKAIQEGFDDFLGKPFRTEELMAILRRHLDVTFVDRAEATPEDTDPAGDQQSIQLPIDARERLQAALKIRSLTAITALGAELAQEPATAAAGKEIGRLANGFNFDGLKKLVE